MLAHLTHRPGVYRMLDAAGTVIYVGKARDLKRRVTSYFQGSRAHDAKTIAMVRTVAGIEVTVTRTEVEALMLEYNLIKEHRPRFNVMLRDDKSYPYILLETEHRFPRLSFYRGPRTSKGRLFGPYPNAGSVRESLNQLHKLFQLRQCEDSYFENRSRPCMQHQIERCTAPCVGLISEEDYASDLEHAVLFLEGHSDVVTARLAERMEQASGALQFERAAQYRDQLAKLKNVQSQQLMARSSGDFDAVGMAEDHGIVCVAVMFFRGGRSLGTRSFFPKLVKGADDDEIMRAFLLQYYGGREAPKEILVSHAGARSGGARGAPVGAVEPQGRDQGARARPSRAVRRDGRRRTRGTARSCAIKPSASYERQLEELCEVLELDEPPTRLECFDVSHTAGEATVASCVVFGPEGPLKSDYRRFNVADVAPGDDYGAMAQVLTRRYARVQKGEVPMPDVLFIDGGPGQLARAIARDAGAQASRARGSSASRRARTASRAARACICPTAPTRCVCRRALRHYT